MLSAVVSWLAEKTLVSFHSQARPLLSLSSVLYQARILLSSLRLDRCVSAAGVFMMGAKRGLWVLLPFKFWSQLRALSHRIKQVCVCVPLSGRRCPFVPHIFIEPSCVPDPIQLSGYREVNKRDIVPSSPKEWASKLTVWNLWWLYYFKNLL